LIVAVVALLVLGPEQLPRLARRGGETLRELRKVREHLGTELRDLVSEFDLDRGPDSGRVGIPEDRSAEAKGKSSL